MIDLHRIAATLDEAAQTATPVPQFSGADTLGVEAAYAVQALSIARRHARGEAHAGFKMGLTSKAKMAQVGVSEVIWGRLTDAMRVEEGGEVARARFIHPRAEPEVAFLMKRDLAGEVGPAEAMAAVEAVFPAIEIIDSRYRDFKFALGDVVADNTSASAFVLGPPSKPDVDVANLGMALEVDGLPAVLGSSAAILGHPVRALVAAARMIGAAGLSLRAGDILLAGAATEAVPLVAGARVRVVAQNLGSVAFTMV